MKQASLSSLPSSRLLRSKLQDLQDLLEADVNNGDTDQEFSSAASAVVNFVHALSLDIERFQLKGISNFGMALLLLELGRPEEARRWWEKDQESSRLRNDEIGDDEMEYFNAKCEELSLRLRALKNF